MRALQSGRWVLAALAIALSTSACGQAPQQPERRAAEPLPAGVEQGRTVNGRTYTNAPVDVKLGPNTFRIPANYLDSQIAPWPGEGVTLVIEWPDMKPTYPGARVHPRTNDFRKEIQVLVNYVDRVPIETLLAFTSSNERTTETGSLEREDPSDRLDLRVAQPEQMGLTPYSIDEGRMDVYVKRYQAKYGSSYRRGRYSDRDWFVGRSSDGDIATLIKCDRERDTDDGAKVGAGAAGTRTLPLAGCVHYIVDLENSLSISLHYTRDFLPKWKTMEVAVRSVLDESKR